MTAGIGGRVAEPMADGLSLPELRELMILLGAADGLVGIKVTCFNPEKDPGGGGVEALAGLLRQTVIS